MCDILFLQYLYLGISSWQHPILFLRDVPFVDLYTILEFIYMGEVNVAQTDLTSFLKTAELLQIKGLAENTATWNQEQDPAEDSGSCGESITGASASASPHSNVSTPSGIGGQQQAGAASRPDKRRRLSSETSTSKLLNDSIASRPASVKDDIEDMELKEEVTDDLDEDNNLYVDESVDTDTDGDSQKTEAEAEHSRRLSSNSQVGQTGQLANGQTIVMGHNHKKCDIAGCGIVMLKKNFARHLRDMHTEPKPRSLCPLCQKSYKTSDWLKDHIRRGHGYTKELTDQLMATLKTPTKAIINTTTTAAAKEKMPPLVSLAANGDTVTKDLSNELNTKPSLALIDIQQQPMTILNSTVLNSIVKQENNVQT